MCLEEFNIWKYVSKNEIKILIFYMYKLLFNWFVDCKYVCEVEKVSVSWWVWNKF